MFFTSTKNSDILKILENIELYLNNNINSLPIIDFECKGYNRKLKDKLDSICKILNQRNEEEL